MPLFDKLREKIKKKQEEIDNAAPVETTVEPGEGSESAEALAEKEKRYNDLLEELCD